MSAVIKNVTFFFPYKQISGIPVLFSNIANFLIKNSKINVNIIDYKDGALIRNCIAHERLNFIEFKDFLPCKINFNTCLILQAGLPYKLRKELIIGEKVKIIQWAAHEFNLVPFISRFNYIRKIQEKYRIVYTLFCIINFKKFNTLKQWIPEMINRGSIVFMTQCIYETTREYLNFKEPNNINFIPNISDGLFEYNKESVNRKAEEVKVIIEIGWIGRLADFKIHILNYSICSLSKLANKKKIKINFHIIGEGEFDNLLSLNLENEYFSIINVGSLEKNQVDLYLEDNLHCLFSMGTSAIDGARLGLPIVLLDQSYLPILNDYKFKYLFNATGFDLGHPVTSNDFESGNDSLNKIIDDLVNDYYNISTKCLNYFNKNHKIDIVVNNLLELFQENYYSIHEVPKEIYRQGIFRKLYLFYLKKVKKSYY